MQSCEQGQRGDGAFWKGWDLQKTQRERKRGCRSERTEPKFWISVRKAGERGVSIAPDGPGKGRLFPWMLLRCYECGLM